MELNIDIIIAGLILFLAIKGLVNGFSKELFNFIGLIGGVALAARLHTTVGELISKQNILPNVNENFPKFLGFIAILLAVWLLFSFISSIFSKVSSNEVGFFSRILGYIIGVARYVAIFSLIIYGVNKADFFKEMISKHTEESKIFTPMANFGGKLLNMEEEQEEKKEEEIKVDTNETNASSESNISMDLNSITLQDHNESNSH